MPMPMPANDIAAITLNQATPLPLRKRILVLDAISFQAVWFACVLSGAYGLPFAALGALALYAGLHGLFINKALPRLAGGLALVAAGIVADAVLTQSALLHYTHHNNALPVPPMWIISLWGALAFSMTASLRWLNGRPLLAFALFGLSGTLSYRAGIALGAAEAPLLSAPTFGTIFICFGVIGGAFGTGLIRLHKH